METKVERFEITLARLCAARTGADDLLGSTNPQRGGRLEARNARVWSSNSAIEQCAQAASDNIVVLIKKLADKVDDPFADAHLSL